jgi:hypothetical protein
MKKNNDSSHGKNVANFKMLLDLCSSFGTVYNPANNALSIASATMLQNSAETVLMTTRTTGAAYKESTNVRAELFATIPVLCTSIINTLDACGASDEKIKDLRSLINKIRGKRVARIEEPVLANSNDPDPKPARRHSVSHVSFDNLIEHFDNLIQLLLTEVKYQPNEASLTVGGLNTLLLSLKNANNAANLATLNFDNARKERDVVLYYADNNLFDVAAGIKKYIKALFGVKSVEYNQAVKLSFASKHLIS